MLTTSEVAVNITIWVLTVSGSFFGIRGVWRRKKQQQIGKLKQVAEKLK
ncbi:MAG: hypothetical protein RW306_10740 [Geobacteraceae bacterium]|nr:hypothetical protein [Geobacteraceae bacterium]